MVSVLIIAKDEQENLPACLTSIAWCQDIHVFDSFSSDRTVEIALAAGATVMQRKFDNYANQRNAALRGSMFKFEWVLVLDADERVPVALLNEINSTIALTEESVGAFRIRRRDFFMGKWLKHAQMSPFYIRLVRPSRVRYSREVNEVIEVEGDVGELKEPFDHFPFSKGIGQWINRHNDYSEREAKRWCDERSGRVAFSFGKALFSADFHERRFHQKGIFYRLPGRPLLKFVYLMFVRGAFLDGKAGIRYAVLIAIYEYFIVLKQSEVGFEKVTCTVVAASLRTGPINGEGPGYR